MTALNGARLPDRPSATASAGSGPAFPADPSLLNSIMRKQAHPRIGEMPNSSRGAPCPVMCEYPAPILG